MRQIPTPTRRARPQHSTPVRRSEKQRLVQRHRRRPERPQQPVSTPDRRGHRASRAQESYRGVSGCSHAVYRKGPGLRCSRRSADRRAIARPWRRCLHPLLRLSCAARLARRAAARCRYCDDACRARAYRDGRRADRGLALGLMQAEAEWNGHTGMISILTPGVRPDHVRRRPPRRQGAVYRSGRCRSTVARSWLQ